MAPRQGFDRDEAGSRYRHDDELRDPIADCDRIRHGVVRVQEGDADLAAISGVYRSGAVDDRDAVPRRESAARHDETDVAIRQRDRHTRADRRAFPRRQHDNLGSGEVGAGITGVRIGGQPMRVTCDGRDQNVDVFGHETRVVQNF